MLTVIDAPHRRFVAQIPDYEPLYGPAFTPEGRSLYAAAGEQIAVFDVAARRRIASVGVGSYAGGVVAAEIDGDCEALAVPWTPTATPTQATASPEPSPTPPPTWSGVWQGIEVRSLSARRGTTASVDVHLSVDTADVAAIEASLSVAPPLTLAADDEGRPRCRVNPDIGKPATTFVFRPSGCTGDTCRAAKALVLSFGDVAPIPDGALLFSCDVVIAADATPGSYPLRVFDVGASDPHGERLPVIGRSGTLTVSPGGGNLQTATNGSRGGMCAVAEPQASAAWPLLPPVLTLLVMRRHMAFARPARVD